MLQGRRRKVAVFTRINTSQKITFRLQYREITAGSAVSGTAENSQKGKL